MSEAGDLKSFVDDLYHEVTISSDIDTNAEYKENEFTRQISEFLIDSGEIEDLTVCYHKSRGMQVNAYSISQDETRLDLFITIFNLESPPTNVAKAKVDQAFSQIIGMLKAALNGHHKALEESSETYDMFLRIYDLKDTLAQVRLYLLTDGIVNSTPPETEDVLGISAKFHIWDINRFYRLATSGKSFEPIEIDFQQTFNTTIPCLSMVDINSDYKGYLAVIPGEILAKIYENYGPRLLERNVRSFLQVRGNVNKGIRNTILKEPHRFFAYNNGISATADEIEFMDNTDNLQICKLRNLQIVNGGQTTASLYNAFKKDKAELKDIYVQAKLSVIPPSQVDEIVPLISRYANSQNKVSDADFYANDPFHVKIEELSRTVWAPATNGVNYQTKWFYERARGQYLDAKGRATTPKKKRDFEKMAPSKQKFTKTDLAKYENTWMQLPHVVSLGAQKNFSHFSVHLKERGRTDVDIKYFEKLIAKAILFKSTEKIVDEQKFGGYRANIVTYTLAWLSHYTSQRLDLEKIWKNQTISPALKEIVREASISIHRIITNPPTAKNITEWCKKKECWETVKQNDIKPSQDINSELSDITSRPEKGIENPNDEDNELIKEIRDVDADLWFQISKWAKETSNLQPWERSLAFSIGKLLSRSGNISYKQAKHGVNILKEAKRLGFKISDNAS